MGENKLKMTDLLLFFEFYVNNLHFTFCVRDNLKLSLGSITIFISKRDILNTLYYVSK